MLVRRLHTDYKVKQKKKKKMRLDWEMAVCGILVSLLHMCDGLRTLLSAGGLQEST